MLTMAQKYHRKCMIGVLIAIILAGFTYSVALHAVKSNIAGMYTSDEPGHHVATHQKKQETRPAQADEEEDSDSETGSVQGNVKRGSDSETGSVQGNVNRRSDLEDGSVQENVQRGSDSETGSVQENVKRGSDSEDGSVQGNVQRGSDSQDGSVQGSVQRGSDSEDGSVQGNVQRGSDSEAGSTRSLGPSVPACSLDVRRERVRDYCQRYPPPIGGRGNRASSVLVDERNKVLFCLINKVGCSMVKRLFTSQAGTSARAAHSERFLAARGFRQLRTYSAKRREEMRATFTKALLVHHPIDRLRSAHQNKFVNSQYLPAAVIRRAIGEFRRDKNYTSRTLSFDEFVRFVTRKNRSDQHWNTFEHVCHPCSMHFDYILRLETLDRDLRYFTTHVLNTTYEKVFHGAFNVGKYHHQGGAAEVTVIDDKYIADVKRLDDGMYADLLDVGYGRDMEMFGYTFDRNASTISCGKQWGCC